MMLRERFGHLGRPTLTTEVATVDNPGLAGRSSALPVTLTWLLTDLESLL
jgi:hypothetical protein